MLDQLHPTLPLGVHRRLSWSDYCADHAYHHSDLKIQKHSLEHLAYYLEHLEESKDTSFMRIGRMFHRLCEYKGLWAYIPISPVWQLTTKAGREARDAFIAQHGQDYVTEEEVKDLQGMWDELQKCDAAASMWNLVKPEDHELTIIWEDKHSGVRCKERLDGLEITTYKSIVDIKTTEDATDLAFQKTILNRHYYSQAAFYLEGAQQYFEGIENFTFIAVERNAPYLVRAYPLHPRAIALGQTEFRAYISEYGNALKTGNWSSSSKQFQMIDLPAYAYKQ